MERSALTARTMADLLAEMGDGGTGRAWVAAWQALATDGWCTAEEYIRMSFPDDPDLADRVVARYGQLASTLEENLPGGPAR